MMISRVRWRNDRYGSTKDNYDRYGSARDKSEEGKMKAFLSAVVFALIVAAAVPYMLASQQQNSTDAFKTSGVRLDDPGHNLIGTN